MLEELDKLDRVDVVGWEEEGNQAVLFPFLCSPGRPSPQGRKARKRNRPNAEIVVQVGLLLIRQTRIMSHWRKVKTGEKRMRIEIASS